MRNTHHCPSVYPTPRLRLDEQVYTCRDDGKSVADDKILMVQPFQLLGVVASEKDEVDVDGHAESPIGIDTKEPEHPQQAVPLETGGHLQLRHEALELAEW